MPNGHGCVPLPWTPLVRSGTARVELLPRPYPHERVSTSGLLRTLDRGLMHQVSRTPEAMSDPRPRTTHAIARGSSPHIQYSSKVGDGSHNASSGWGVSEGGLFEDIDRGGCSWQAPNRITRKTLPGTFGGKLRAPATAKFCKHWPRICRSWRLMRAHVSKRRLGTSPPHPATSAGGIYDRVIEIHIWWSHPQAAKRSDAAHAWGAPYRLGSVKLLRARTCPTDAPRRS